MKRENEAVSPVVGVMLMLVVTIIIAAVVSAFAGSMASTQEKAPSASFRAAISNDGSWGGSSFDLICLGTDEGIQTRDLKLTTSWTASDGTSGGMTITGPMDAPNVAYDNASGTPKDLYCAPIGFGPGVGDWKSSGGFYVNQYYGNYTFMTGTKAHNGAYGWNEAYGGYGVSPDTRYEYTAGTDFDLANQDTDAMMAILGDEWYKLMPGDKVRVKLTHIPSGTVIYDEDVVVEG
ncbi:MAG: type IV pilin N-terminal domain-containing protein [Methanomicrobiaceae archaeon]|nr:type IV pilin N-terminal domain-containing protein [Methanomicrobiaceae archaeon]